jgi:pteridine reductase
MLNRGGGKIVNIVDVNAERRLDHHLAYCVSKAGLAMLTRGLAKELAPTVAVNGVAPGAAGLIERDGEDVARAVRFLCEEGDHITGQVLAVDGGKSL